MFGIESVKSLELHWQSLLIRKVAVKLLKYCEVFSIWRDWDIPVAIRRGFNIGQVRSVIVIQQSAMSIDPRVYHGFIHCDVKVVFPPDQLIKLS